MTLPVFVVDAAALRADRIELTGDEGRHAAVVKRIRVGERIVLTDGSGNGTECDRGLRLQGRSGCGRRAARVRAGAADSA